jgi:hypothetical protein
MEATCSSLQLDLSGIRIRRMDGSEIPDGTIVLIGGLPFKYGILKDPSKSPHRICDIGKSFEVVVLSPDRE